MSITYQTLCHRSLRKVGAVEAGGTPSGDEFADALADLNMMLANWLELGIPIGDGTGTLSTTLAVDVTDEEGVMFCLARRLLVEYPAENSALIIDFANKAESSLLGKYGKPPAMEVDDALNNVRQFNINTGE